MWFTHWKANRKTHANSKKEKQIDGETVETVSDFILGGSKITKDGDCSHGIKRHLLLGTKVMTNLDSIFKSRDITLLTKVRLVKAMVFPVVMYWYESWTIKKAEHWRIDAFELWCWRRLLRVPWTARRSNHSKRDQSWVFLGKTDSEAETPILWPPHVKSWLIGKDFDAGRNWGQEEKGMTEDEMAGWHHWLDWRESEWTLGVGNGQGGLGVLWFMGSQRVRHDCVTKLNWTEQNKWYRRSFAVQWENKDIYKKQMANAHCHDGAYGVPWSNTKSILRITLGCRWGGGRRFQHSLYLPFLYLLYLSFFFPSSVYMMTKPLPS